MTPYRENAREAETLIRVPAAGQGRIGFYVAIALFLAIGALRLNRGGWTAVSCDRTLGAPHCTAVEHSLTHQVRETIATNDVALENVGSANKPYWLLRVGQKRFDKGVDEAFGKRIEARTRDFFADDKSPGFSESQFEWVPFVFAGGMLLVIIICVVAARFGVVVIGDRGSGRIGIAQARLFGRTRPRWVALSEFHHAITSPSSTEDSEVLLMKTGTAPKTFFTGKDALCREVTDAINQLRGK